MWHRGEASSSLRRFARFR
ncbi:MAG: hypothetical protein ACXV7J_04400 [Methylomonas sp.]